MTYQEKWTWEGKSDKGSFEWVDWDGVLRSGQPWTQALEDEVTAKTRATYEATVLAEFIQLAASKGMNVQIQNVNVTAEMVKDAEQTSCYYVSRGEHYQCNHRLPFFMRIKGVVDFTSDQPWTGASLTAIALYILQHIVWKIIVAIGVLWALGGVYTFLSRLALHETSSEITETWIDEQGNVHTKTEKRTETGTDIGGLIVLGGLVIGGFWLFQHLLSEWKHKHTRRKSKH